MKLHMMIGLPRSGKSTLARTMGFPIVNPDSIRLAVHGLPFLPQAETLVWYIAHKMVEALFNAGHDDVILDATNVCQSRRQEWEELYECEYHPVLTSPEECVRRAISLGQYDLVPVIADMTEKWDWHEEWKE